MLDSLRVNGVPFSWTSSVFRIGGQAVKGIVAVDWAEKRERKLVQAMDQSGVPLGITSGQYSIESFSFKALVGSWAAIADVLSIAGLGSYGDATFPIQVQAIEPSIGSIPLIMNASGMVVTGVKESRAVGVEELVKEVTLMGLTIIENGHILYSLQRQFLGL